MTKCVAGGLAGDTDMQSIAEVAMPDCVAKIWLDDYRKRRAAIEEHNRKVRLINLINRLKAGQNKSNNQNSQPVHA